jgi:signal transduction histidine kinase
MKLSWKINMMPMVAGLGFFLYFGVVFWGTRSVDRTMTMIQDSFFHALEISHDLETNALGIRHLLTNSMTSGNPDLVAEADVLADSFRRGVESCRTTPGLATGRLDTLDLAFGEYYGIARVTALESSSDSGDLNLEFDDALLRQIAAMNEKYGTLQGYLREGVQITNDAMAEALSETRQRMIRLRRTMNLLALVFLVILIFLSVGVKAAIMRPVRRLSRASRAIARGDLNQKLEYQSDDALGRLADSFREMQTALIDDIRQREAAESELIAAQGQIIQSEKMAVLGQLVAGLTHELNTPLGAMTSSANVVSRCGDILSSKCGEAESLETLRSDRRFQKALSAMGQGASTVETAAGRISELVTGLKAFSQLDQAERQETDLNEGLRTTFKLIEHQIPRNVEFHWELGNIPRVIAWPAQLHQLFLVLIRNAMESIEGAGTITITSRQSDQTIQVIIEDTGTGFDPEQLRALFDPGFGARSKTVRMDWGMISAAGIAERHGGNLRAVSTPGQGSTFTLSLSAESTG